MLRLVSEQDETYPPEESSSPPCSELSHNKVESSEADITTDVQLFLALDEEIEALESEIRSALQRRRHLINWRKSLDTKLPPDSEMP
jgi:DNA replication initiation complex subunit (GINS family)